ncbi:Di-copper centre-containing protein [Melanomma pulvis-pyrius CBS 109.77]|uniref:Di-copper centre-containing protein n=1 Tax=Melanomma pulvis-pyrius CBS 109.77 TaxID=1314802 RepID=A0A6A6XS31_9PLEO|nr:Di-copper centre-containing protein [Melanomma pulvis-pyrius CBS 109.77]
MVPACLALLFSSVLIGVGAGPVKTPFSLNRRSDGFPYPLDDTDKLEEASLAKFEAYLAKKNGTSHGCTLENAVRRQEWHDLSVAQREEYIRAVLCLQSLPPKADKKKYPGLNNRYDDFVLTHETQAFHLHSTPHLFPAHRLYIWAYEKALREECGYTGYQPYWNWGRTASDPANSPLFNGNMSSMSGNGKKADYPGVKTTGFQKPYDVIPPDQGGGCVTSGPFANMTISLGPIGGVLSDVPPNPQADGFGANPRCLRRDVNKFSSAQTHDNYTYSLITTSGGDINKFQQDMLGIPAQNNWGVHMAGHYTIGGDPGGDFFSSPGDPVFWFHHGMVDRIWWIWQMQDPENRMNQLPENPAKDDFVDLNWTAERADTWDLVDSIGGHKGAFCYIYV